MRVKRAHMVSKGYIRAWANERNALDVIDIENHLGFRASIENATVVSRVYDPKVLSHDLESDYQKIETDGIPVIVKLREDRPYLTTRDRAAMVAFLDMFLERGRYADRAKRYAEAQVLKVGGVIEEVQIGLGDAVVLSRSLPEVSLLSDLGIDQWDWKVWPLDDPSGEGGVTELVTGDGAVLLWCPSKQSEVCTITFPLSPTRLLVIGSDLPDGVPMNDLIATKSKRWIVGACGALNLDWFKSSSISE